MASSSMADDRLEILGSYFSRVTQSELKALPARFDIPASYPLETPTRSEVIYKPGSGRSPLYVKHLEFGLRLPLHPFVEEVCSALGISPVQLKPNAIAAITAFIVICYWLGLKPSLAAFIHLVDVRVYKKDPHYFFMNRSSFKLVEDLPDSIKDWKENFVWVEGDDVGLHCSGWPEATKENFKARPLSSANQEILDKVKSFSGSRKLKDLFDKSVLRVAGISPVKPSSRDHERAVKLIFGSDAVVEEHRPRPEAHENSLSRPAKRLREDAPQVPLIKSSGTSPLPTTAIMQPTQQIAPQVVPARKQRSKVPSQGPRGADEGARGGISRPPALSIQVPTERVEKEIPARSSHRPGKEPSTRESSPVPEDLNWPYPHRLNDIDEATWTKLKRLMVGSSVASPRQEQNVREEDRFEPARYLDKKASVIESRTSQKTAVEQFWLPRDREILASVPDTGLHQILRSYLVRGTVVEEEIFRRLSGAKALHEKLQATFSRSGVEEGSDLENALLQLSAKEDELVTWKGELEVREKMIEDLKASNAEMAAELDKFHGKTSGGEAETGGVNQALFERDRALVQVECERQAAQSARRQLEEEQIAHGRTRAENVRLGEALKGARAEITHLRSAEWRKQVIDEWRSGLIGRAEVTLACKAGYDYLWAQLPAEMKSDGGHFYYPPRIASCVEALEEIEQQGGVFNLDEEDEEEKAPVEETDKMGEDLSSQPEGMPPADRVEKVGGGSSSPSSQPVGGDTSGLPATPPHTITSELPLTPGAGMDFS